MACATVVYGLDKLAQAYASNEGFGRGKPNTFGYASSTDNGGAHDLSKTTQARCLAAAGDHTFGGDATQEGFVEIRAAQDERDQRRLASKKLTLRQKERIREGRARVDLAPNPAATASTPSPDRLAHAISATRPLDRSGGEVAAFMARFAAEQKAKQQKASAIGNQRKRDRELLKAKSRADDVLSGTDLAAANRPLVLPPPLRKPDTQPDLPRPAVVPSSATRGPFLIGQNGVTSKWA